MSRKDALCRLAEAHGASINRQGGVYVNGEACSFAKKLEVAAACQAARDENGGERPNISQLVLPLPARRGVQPACERPCRCGLPDFRKAEKW